MSHKEQNWLCWIISVHFLAAKALPVYSRLCWLISITVSTEYYLTWEQLYRLGSLVTHTLQDSIERYFFQSRRVNSWEWRKPQKEKKAAFTKRSEPVKVTG